jgi:hypothetical protein
VTRDQFAVAIRRIAPLTDRQAAEILLAAGDYAAHEAEVIARPPRRQRKHARPEDLILLAQETS